MPRNPLAKAIYAEIGTRIGKFRHDLGLTQEALAGEIGVTRTTISNLEKGRQFLPLAQLYAIAEVLGRSITEIIPLREEVEASLSQVEFPISGVMRSISQQDLQNTLLSVAVPPNEKAGGSDDRP